MFRHSVLLVLLTVVLVSATAVAQQPGGRRGGFGRSGMPRGLSFLLAVPDIREHLSISDEQEQLFGALIVDLRSQRFAARDRQGPPANPAQPGEFSKRMDKLTQQGDELIGILLEPKQVKRLHEIRLQYDGVRALNRPDFAKSLRLNEEQQEQILAIRGDSPRGRVNPEQAAQILATLTDEQKETWNRMKGKVYVFPDWLADYERGSGRRGRRRNRPRRP